MHVICPAAYLTNNDEGIDKAVVEVSASPAREKWLFVAFFLATFP